MLVCINVLGGYFAAVYVFVNVIVTYILASPLCIQHTSTCLNNKRDLRYKFS